MEVPMDDLLDGMYPCDLDPIEYEDDPVFLPSP